MQIILYTSLTRTTRKRSAIGCAKIFIYNSNSNHNGNNSVMKAMKAMKVKVKMKAEAAFSDLISNACRPVEAAIQTWWIVPILHMPP